MTVEPPMIFFSKRWLVVVIVLLLPLTPACQRESGHYQTCTVCGSARVIDSRTGERILYRSRTFAHGGMPGAMVSPRPSTVRFALEWSCSYAVSRRLRGK